MKIQSSLNNDSMKKLLILLAGMLFLTGCQPTGGESGGASIPGSESSALTGEVVDEELSLPADPSPSEPEASDSGDWLDITLACNSGLELIPGGDLLMDSAQGLFMLKEYGFEMKWSEANQLEHLERGTPVDADRHDTYFLLLPKYIGSQITVERLDWSEDKKEFVSTSTLYSHEDIPDSYGLILTSDEPETWPNLRITVEYQGKKADYTFSYDGRGDRPAIQILPRSEQESDTAVSSVTVPHRLEIDTFLLSMEIPAAWEATDIGFYFSHVEGDREIAYTAVFYPVSEEPLEDALKPETENDPLYQFTLADGRTSYAVLERDSPSKYFYVLETDGRLITLMVMLSENVPAVTGPEGFRTLLLPPHEATTEF